MQPVPGSPIEALEVFRNPDSEDWERDYAAVSSRSAVRSVVAGALMGLLLGVVAIFLAILPGSAGHGDYAAARLLFPGPMLLTLIQDDRIGALSMVVALLQFPFYGGVLGWSAACESYLSAMMVGSLHLIAVIACFAGTLPNFS